MAFSQWSTVAVLGLCLLKLPLLFHEFAFLKVTPSRFQDALDVGDFNLECFYSGADGATIGRYRCVCGQLAIGVAA